MASSDRQNLLLINEDWSKIYRSFSDADFSSYDFPTLRRTMINYLRKNYPEEFNDYIESSEYLALIDMIAFLGQSISYRVDLNARENFIETAERRDSVLRLARLVGYNPKRNQPASGLLKITAIQTTDSVNDSLGNNLSNTLITWNDTANNNWLEQFNVIMNSTMPSQNSFGKPNASETINGIQTDQYRISSINNDVPVFTFNKAVQGRTLNFEVISAGLENNTITEETPLPGRPMGIIYQNDKRGNSSPNTGFFMNFKQGQIQSSAFTINDASNNEVINIDVPGINNNDVWLWGIDQNGNFRDLWTKLDSIYGSNVIYNSVSQNIRTLYSVATRDNDEISLNFADGAFGDLPKGNFRVYYRTSNGLRYIVRPTDLQGIVLEIPYTNKNGISHTLTVQLGLQSTVTNATPAESTGNIRLRAPQAYYTQNRMVTGEDYNTLPLTSNQEIVKAKAVNRVSSGISRQFDIQDPTGKYSTTNLIADDGIIYKDDFENDFTFTFTTRNDILGIVRNNIEPILSGIQTKAFYYDKYPNISIGNLNIDWVNATSSSTSTTGYFRNTVTDAPVTVGSFTGNNFKFVKEDAMVKFVPPTGRYFLPNGELTSTASKTTRSYIWAKVLSVFGDGSNNGVGLLDDNTGPVVLSEKIPSLAIPSVVIPNIVTNLPTNIETEIVDLAFAYKTFGVRYDQNSQSWKVITNANVNTVSNFSLDRQGDTTGTKADRSWIVLFETDGETYTITYRGLDYRFESEKLVTFYPDPSGKVYDPSTGTVVKDQIKVLKVNEDPVADGILAKDYQWEVVSSVINTDGFSEYNKIKVNFYDSDDDGMIDDPDSFENIVKPDSLNADDYKDKFVFFQTTNVSGTAVTSKVSKDLFLIYDKETSVSSFANVANGQLFYFYSDTENVVKSYDSTLGALVLETDYFAKPGRDGIKFQYIHNAENDRRLDPSKTNIMDLYVLTRTYDNSFRTYLNGSSSKPIAPTSVQLEQQFGPSLEKVKSISDEIIFHPAKYRELFGSTANESLRATFKIVKNPASAVSDNEIKTRVIDAINEYFSIDFWEFGDSFYFTELATYVQTQLVPDVVNFVIVPRSSSQSFGSLYQVSSQPDEIFVSTATVDQVEIIESLTQTNIRATGAITTSVNTDGDVVVSSDTITTNTTSTSSGSYSSGGSSY